MPNKLITLFTCLLVCSYTQAGEICITTESDPDGDGFGWEQESTCLVTEASSRVPEFYDPRTGEKRNIQRLKWVTSDFADKSFTECHGYLVDPDAESDQCLSCDSGESYDYKHFEDGNGRLVYSFGETKFEADFSWSIDIYGIYNGPLPITGFAEITDTGIRQWLEGKPDRIGFYQQCEGAIPSTMVLDPAPDSTPGTDPVPVPDLDPVPANSEPEPMSETKQFSAKIN